MVARPPRRLIAVILVAVAAATACSTDDPDAKEWSLIAAVMVSDDWPCRHRSIHLAIWLEPEITTAEATDIERRVRRLDGVEMSCLLDRDATFEEYTELFADEPELLAAVTPEELPTSWRLRLVEPSGGDLVEAEFEGLPGVRSVVTRSGFQLALPAEPDEPDVWPAHDLIVWIRADAAPAERSEVIERLTGDSAVASVTTWSAKRNVREFVRWADDEIDVAGVGPEDLALPLFVTVAEGVGTGAVGAAYEGLPGVRTVVANPDGLAEQ